MNLLGLYHRVDGIYGYQEKNGSFNVRLRMAKNQAIKVEVIFGDRYNWTHDTKKGKWSWNFEKILEMTKLSSDDLYDYFEINLNDSSKEHRYKYAFKIYSQKQVWLYGENDCKNITNQKINLEIVNEIGFSWGYSTKSKYVSAPGWWKKTNWYQVFPDRFANNNGTLKQTNIEKHEDKMGGTLKGITKKISYIKKLGFNGLYLNPIFEASSSHMYDTTNYLEINPSLGTIDDFKKLVQMLKKHNMKLMLDGVFNHSGINFQPWKDVLKNKEKSKYKDWFYINDIKKLKNAKEYKNLEFTKNKIKSYSTFANTPFMPRINSENSKVQKYFKKVVEFWTKLGVDAWRLDVADEPSFDFWRKFRIWAKKVKNDVAILGEVWYDSLIFLHGDQFDSTMNYPLRMLTLDYFVNKKIAFDEFKNIFISKNFQLSLPVKHSLFNLLSSHDTSRFIEECKGDINKWKTSFTWLYLNPGSTCFYYGDEYYLNKKISTPEKARFIMDWTFDKKNTFYKHTKKILEIRHKNLEIIFSGIIDINQEKEAIKITYKKGQINFSQKNGNILEIKKC